MNKTFTSLALSAAALVVFAIPGFCAPQPPQGHHPMPGVQMNKPQVNHNHVFQANKPNVKAKQNKFVAQKPPKFDKNNKFQNNKYNKNVYKPKKNNNYNAWNRPGYNQNFGRHSKYQARHYKNNRFSKYNSHNRIGSNRQNYRYW